MKWPGKKATATEQDDVFEDDEDFNFERIGLSEEKGTSKWRRVVLISVLLVAIGGVAWWYLVGSVQQSDESALPVIRAEIGPIKVRPKNPGGMEIPNRDKLIYERLGTGPGAPLVERLLPEPEKPVPMPVTELETKSTQDVASEGAGEVKPDMQPLHDTQEQSEAPQSAATTPLKLEPQLVEPVPQAVSPAATPLQSAEVDPAAKPAPKPTPVVISENAYRIQLAAVRSEDDAVREWGRLSKKYPDLLTGLSLATQKADLGDKGVFYRIRVGPLANEAAAKKLCADLAEKKVGCLVVRP